MCGIVGIWMKGAHADALKAVERGISALTHRGPDDIGLLETLQAENETAVIFGHRRLSIIDLSQAGHQPMEDSESGLCITYNGEIYNYLSLRKELENVGREWASHTDTEVVLRAFAKWGVGS